MDFSTYLTLITDALRKENGPNLAYLLRPTSPHGKDRVKSIRSPSVSRPLDNRCRWLTVLEAASLAHYKGSIAGPWDEAAIQYVLTCSHIAHGRSGEAFKAQCQLVSCVVRAVLRPC